MKDLTPEGYKYVLQGPGSGMYYNGTIYMPIQAWHHEKDQPDKSTATSGFIYSTDNGKTWNSAILRPENYPVGAFGKPDISSESNIFHHNGKIYLAAKPETSRESKKELFMLLLIMEKLGKELKKILFLMMLQLVKVVVYP